MFFHLSVLLHDFLIPSVAPQATSAHVKLEKQVTVTQIGINSAFVWTIFSCGLMVKALAAAAGLCVGTDKQ